MDYRERIPDLESALRALVHSSNLSLWTALPGMVQSFDSGAMTVSVQPAIRAKIRAPDGSLSSVALPLLVDVPVVFPGGGGFSLTFPIKGGEDCLVVFAARCIDAWWQSGGVQEAMEARTHDLSDGFAFVGVRSQPSVIPSISAGSTQLRSDDGATFVEVTDGKIVHIKAPGNLVVEAPTCQFKTGALVVTGRLEVQNEGGSPVSSKINGTIETDKDVIASGISLRSHVHSGVETGPGDTRGPK